MVKKVEYRRLVNVNELRHQLTSSEAKVRELTAQLEEQTRRNASLHAKVTTCKALMTDQFQKFGNQKKEMQTEIERLMARVAELEYQMMHGGSDAEKAIRAQMMEAYTAKLKDEFNQEVR